MGRAERIAALVAWTVLAAFLFMGFGMALGEAVALTVDRLGLGARPRLDLLVYVVRALAGVGMLGISRLYRMLAEQENAGSLAAWLAGWALVLYSVAAAAALVDEQAAPLVLLTVLAVWAVVRLSRYFAHYDVEDEESADTQLGRGRVDVGRGDGSEPDDRGGRGDDDHGAHDE
ncbi:MAG: hypothetical protein ACYCX3_10520 [Thermoleophilia bacterium]